MTIKSKFHPNVIPAGVWMNSGFSTDKNLAPWEVMRAGTEIFREGL